MPLASSNFKIENENRERIGITTVAISLERSSKHQQKINKEILTKINPKRDEEKTRTHGLWQLREPNNFEHENGQTENSLSVRFQLFENSQQSDLNL